MPRQQQCWSRSRTPTTSSGCGTARSAGWGQRRRFQAMAETTVELRNPSGLHARPAATFVKAATGFKSDIRVTNLTRNAEKSAAAKSMLGVLGLGVSHGHTIRITAEGEDADEAVSSLREMVEAGLGEAMGG